MKALFLMIVLLSVNTIHAQQSFINVPSGEATKPHKLFFQQQLNINELIQSNTTLDYGLGKGCEVGANLLGLNFNEKRRSFLNNDTNDVDPYNPLVAINGLKQIELGEKIALTLGAQAGLNFRTNKRTYEAGLIYTDLIFHDLILKKDKWVGGVYYNSLHYGGKGTRVGGWMAVELPIVNKLHIMGESILGDNALCNSSVGIIYYPRPYLPLTFGFQIPNIKRNSYAFVFELTFIP